MKPPPSFTVTAETVPVPPSHAPESTVTPLDVAMELSTSSAPPATSVVCV